MTPKEQTIELIAQTLAPRLYQLCGEKPEEMGFPIYETKSEVDDHLERQFNPVEYWMGQARRMAESIIRIIDAGGGQLDNLNIDAMCKAATGERPDVNTDGIQKPISELIA